MEISHLGLVPAGEIPLKGGAVLWIRRWRRWFQARLELDNLALRGATWLHTLGSGWDERQPRWWWWANTHSPWRLRVKSEQIKLVWKCVTLSTLGLTQFSPCSFSFPHSPSLGTPDSPQPGILQAVLMGTVLFSKDK